MQWQTALWLLHSWPEPADLIGYSSAITACTRGRQLLRALDILAVSQRLQLGSDEVLTGSLITASEKLARWDLALHVLGAFDLSTNIICYNAALAACEKAFQWQWSLELWKILLCSMTPDATTFASLAEACRRQSRWQEGFAIFARAMGYHVKTGGRALSIQVNMACDAQAYPAVCSSVSAMQRTFVQERGPSQGMLLDPDEGTPKRLADMAAQLRTFGLLPGRDRRFIQEVLHPVLMKMRSLSHGGDVLATPHHPGLNTPNILDLVVSGLGGMERDALTQMKMQCETRRVWRVRKEKNPSHASCMWVAPSEICGTARPLLQL